MKDVNFLFAFPKIVLWFDARVILAVQFSSVHSLSLVWLFVTPWTAACQASLSITNSRSLLKLMSIESVIPSNYLILFEEPTHWKRHLCFWAWGHEEKVVTDEMVRQHHWLNGHEFESTPGGSEGLGSLACCSSWGCKE